jgi:two-component system OmpR family sensor kinase/two-component system sensor histidine kinase BaeS
LMSHPPASQPIRIIRRRLFLLLLRALSVMVLFVLFLSLIGYVFISNPDIARYKVIFSRPQLQSYYLEHDSWEGVEAEVSQIAHFPFPRSAQRWWEGVYLVDAGNRVLIDQGRTGTALVGQVYTPADGDQWVPIRVGGETVGSLILRRENAGSLIRFFIEILFPLGGVAFFGGLLIALIGALLVRRVVNPLAEVIAAAQAVARGDLSARVKVSGPSDLRALSDNFNHMAEALERNEQERRNLLADVAHELRTPLTVMRGKLEGILDGIYPADARHVAPVLEETYLLERLVEDLRLLTLAEARQLPLDLKSIQLEDVARRAMRLFEAQAAEKRITLEIQAEPGLPTVYADPQRVEQVIGNLIGNALRYVPEEGKVWTTIRQVDAGVEVAIQDNGPGVPEADLPRLFERFWRGEKSRSRASGGAGLGLAIARQLVEAQDGAISAANLPAGGLKVMFVLPRSI